MNETLDIDIIKEPYDENLDLIYNHLSRYRKAIEIMDLNTNDIVVDFGCGNGYGSQLISKYANKVISIDKNDEYLKTAMTKNTKKNIFYVNNDIDFLKQIDNLKIICIEVIEHIKQEEQIILLELFKNIGKELFLTFPVGKNKKSKYNKYHLCEPSLEFIYDNIKDKYSKIDIEIKAYLNSFKFIENGAFLYAR